MTHMMNVFIGEVWTVAYVHLRDLFKPLHRVVLDYFEAETSLSHNRAITLMPITTATKYSLDAMCASGRDGPVPEETGPFLPGFTAKTERNRKSIKKCTHFYEFLTTPFLL